jgi:hypothetical protein
MDFDFEGEPPLVLLGAGASKPAGLPLTAEMSEHMADPASSGPGAWDDTHLEPEDARVIRFVIGALQMRKGVENENPFSKVNVEDVFSSIEKLADRSRLQISPFVNSWHEAVSDIEPVGRTDESNQSDFADAAVRMEKELVNILWFEAGDNSVSYLRPMIEEVCINGGTIATLNYDNSVELSASNADIRCETGFGRWVGRDQPTKSFEDAELLKLHGSLNWRYNPHSRSVRDFEELSPTSEEKIYHSHPGRDSSERLGVIFGTGQKLQSEGPFLDILQEFRRRLHEHRRLIVIGYSFGDSHINYQIREWLEGVDGRKILIIGGPKETFENHPLSVGVEQEFFAGTPLEKDQVEFSSAGASKGISDLFA